MLLAVIVGARTDTHLHALARCVLSTLVTIRARCADKGAIFLATGGVLQSTLWVGCDTFWDICRASLEDAARRGANSARDALDRNVNFVRLTAILWILVMCGRRTWW